jgi:phage terminase small subunit
MRRESGRRSPATPRQPADRISERERRFVEHFMGAAVGNATKAARLAGYSPKTARKQGSRLLTKGHIRAALAQRTQDDPAVWSREERQHFWTDVARGAPGYATASLRDRLKASELLGKSQADFVDRHQVEAGGALLELLAAATAQIEERD